MFFTNAFIYAASDGLIDQREYVELYQKANNVIQYDPDSIDSQIAKQSTDFLNKQTKKIKITYRIPKIDDSLEPRELNFIFTPTYSENDFVKGNSIIDIVSNISQDDVLTYTDNDSDRCGSASLLNAYLLLGGKFETIASKFDLPATLSYKNVHIIQEKLYDYANEDKKVGLTAGHYIKYNVFTGKVRKVTAIGEILKVAEMLNIKITPLISDDIDGSYQKKDEVQEFFRKNPNGVLQVGVYLRDDGSILPYNLTEEQNHFILIFKYHDKFYMANTGTNTNGDGSAVRELNLGELVIFLYNNDGDVNALTLNKK